MSGGWAGACSPSAEIVLKEVRGPGARDEDLVPKLCAQYQETVRRIVLQKSPSATNLKELLPIAQIIWTATKERLPIPPDTTLPARKLVLKLRAIADPLDHAARADVMSKFFLEAVETHWDGALATKKTKQLELLISSLLSSCARRARTVFVKKCSFPMTCQGIVEVLEAIRQSSSPDEEFLAQVAHAKSLGVLGAAPAIACALQAENEDSLGELFDLPPPRAVGQCAHFRDPEPADEEYWKHQSVSRERAESSGLFPSRPREWLFSIGTDEKWACIRTESRVLLPGGGLLCRLPALDQESSPRFVAVEPRSGRTRIFEVSPDRSRARVLSSCFLPLPTEEIDEESKEPPRAIPIDWIDAQRDDDFRLYFLFGSRTCYTGTTRNV